MCPSTKPNCRANCCDTNLIRGISTCVCLHFVPLRSAISGSIILLHKGSTQGGNAHTCLGYQVSVVISTYETWGGGGGGGEGPWGFKFHLFFWYKLNWSLSLNCISIVNWSSEVPLCKSRMLNEPFQDLQNLGPYKDNSSQVGCGIALLLNPCLPPDSSILDCKPKYKRLHQH